MTFFFLFYSLKFRCHFILQNQCPFRCHFMMLNVGVDKLKLTVIVSENLFRYQKKVVTIQKQWINKKL
jgi:hypothetical protein